MDDATRFSRRWATRPAGSCSTFSARRTGRRSASSARASTWRGNRRRSTSGSLEAANLVSTVWRGREKLHFINPVPLHEVYERWVRKFERQRLACCTT